MENTTNQEMLDNGNVNISDEVVSIIASMAASGVAGVAGMVSSISGGFAELLGKKNMSKGVKISVTDKNVTLDLAVIVEYGAKIPDVAWEIQEKVKSEVESMTGLHVVAVNISVDGVNVPKPEKETEAGSNDFTEQEEAAIGENGIPAEESLKKEAEEVTEASVFEQDEAADTETAEAQGVKEDQTEE